MGTDKENRKSREEGQMQEYEEEHIEMWPMEEKDKEQKVGTKNKSNQENHK